MRNLISLLTLIGVAACANPAAPDTPTYGLELDARLSQNVDGYYEMAVNPNTTQTIHRISGRVTIDGLPLENQRVEWESSHSWTIGDTLVVIVRKECPYPDQSGVDCIWYISNVGAVKDTVLLTQFAGQEVPTVNGVSLSAPDGEINTVFAPVYWMVGDTVTVTANALFPGPDMRESIQVILR